MRVLASLSGLRRPALVAVLLAMTALSAGCGEAPSATPEPVPAVAEPPTSTPSPVVEADAPSPTPEASSAPAPSPTAPATPVRRALPEGYDANQTMFALYSGAGHEADDTLRTLQLIREVGDISQVPIIIEVTRFLGSQPLDDEAAVTLGVLTGQDLGSPTFEWGRWMEWLGRNADEYPPPSDYLRWKIDLYSLIDPRFEGFLAPAADTAHVNLTEVVWGGVPPDGIPDLQFTPVLDALQADYLFPNDRVFGVSINGEHRAYPLRIVNAHEMANDVLGGEPIALAY